MLTFDIPENGQAIPYIAKDDRNSAVPTIFYIVPMLHGDVMAANRADELARERKAPDESLEMAAKNVVKKYVVKVENLTYRGEVLSTGAALVTLAPSMPASINKLLLELYLAALDLSTLREGERKNSETSPASNTAAATS